MIGKGAQYLTAAGFGRYRITAASLGRDWIIKPWLTAATKQAIMAAFGVDGPEVIAATNEYLTGIAASDQAKATALAGFINEDPMMVCSVGIEGIQWRWLRSYGVEYIDLKVKPSNNASIDIAFRRTETSRDTSYGLGAPFGTRVGFGFTCVNDPNAYYFNFGGSTNSMSGTRNTNEHVIHMSKEQTTYDGTQRIGAVTRTGTDGGTCLLYGWRGDSATNVRCAIPFDFKYCDYADTGVSMVMRPFRLGKAWSADKVSTGVAQAKDTLGMIDLVTGIFYPNAASSGAFTMEGEPTP